MRETIPAVIGVALLFSQATGAQPLQRSPQVTSTASTADLPSRLSTAAAARASGDPSSIAAANTSVVALALRQFGDLRAAEYAFGPAEQLYKESLALEQDPGTATPLATVAAQDGKYDEAIAIAQTLQRSEPDNVQANRILSSALIQKGDFVQALAPLTRVAQVDHSVDTQYALANCLLQTKRPADKARAQEVFRKIEAEHGDTGSLHVLIGRAYRDSGDLNAAVQEFQRALAIDPRTPHAHYFLGLAKLSLNEWKPTVEAEAEIKSEAELYPHDYLANYMAGFLASGERRYDEAAPFLKAAALIDPTAPEPHLYLGLDAYAKSDNAAAEAELRAAVTLTGKDEARSNYQIRRAYVDLGRILANSGRKDESEVFLAKARDLQNKTMEQSQQTIAGMAGASANVAAVVALHEPKDETKTQGFSQDETAPLDLNAMSTPATLTDPQRTELQQREQQLRAVLALAYNDLGTSEAVQGHFPAAVSLYRKAEDWDSTLPGLEKNLGQSEFRASDFEAAVSPLTQALLQQPESHGLRAMLGITYFNLNRFAEACRTFAPLGPAGMQDTEVGYAWAASLARTGDMAKATEVLTAYTSQPHPVDIQLLVGQLWTVIGDYARAISTLHAALVADPSLPKAHLYTGLAYIHWEHWPEAAKEFQAELSVTPGDPDAAYHLGFVYLQQARIDAAVQMFRDVVAVHPGYANAQYQLGKVQLERGEVENAIQHLQAAEQASPGTDYIHYQLQAAYRKASRTTDADKELELYKQLKANARAQAADRASVH